MNRIVAVLSIAVAIVLMGWLGYHVLMDYVLFEVIESGFTNIPQGV